MTRHCWKFWLTFAVMVASASTLLRTAEARVERYALVVGNDVGAPGEDPLMYAEADATKVSGVLKALGDFRPENMVLLLGEGADSFERVLIALNARIRAERSAGSEAMLLVYYSGHADAMALHLGSDRLKVQRVRKLVQGSAADFRMLLLDACRSGALTRVKGGNPAVPFAIHLDSRLAGEGVAFLTSSSANEDAQESDALKGSFFTHYFVSGLRGAADRNHDGAVSVEEAYGHAYHHTLRASSKTLHGTQHPTFRFDLKGRGSIPLTFVSRLGGRRAQLKFPTGRSYLVFARGAGGPVVAEVSEHDSERTLSVMAGKYYVRGRARDHLLEGGVSVPAGSTLLVQDGELNRVEYARLTRKGSPGRRLSHGPWLGYQLRTPLWPEASACHGMRLGYELSLPWLTLTPRLGACRSYFSNQTLEARADEWDIDVSLTHVFDLPGVSLGAGIAIGGAWLRQEFETLGLAPARDTAAGQASALGNVAVPLPVGFFVLGEIGGQLYVFEEQDGAQESRRTAAKLTARGVLAAGKLF